MTPSSWLPFDPTPIIRDSNLKTLNELLPGASIRVYRDGRGPSKFFMQVFVEDETQYPDFFSIDHLDAMLFEGGGATIILSTWAKFGRGRDGRRRYLPSEHRAATAHQLQSALEALALMRSPELDIVQASAALAPLVDELIANYTIRQLDTSPRP